MSKRLSCQVCGRGLVPLKDGTSRRHTPGRPGTGGDEYYRCPGSGYRLDRWPVGQHLRHHAGSVWKVVEDVGGKWGAYRILCLFVPTGISERPPGTERITHGEYMHRHGWTPVAPSEETE